MREEFIADEVSLVESVARRDRKLRPSIPTEPEPVKSGPASEESSGSEPEPTAEGKAPQPRRETPRRRRGQAESYDEVFLKRKDFKIRQSVYISKETHAEVGRLVHLLGMAGKEISVGGYIDNVVAEHLESHKEFIAEMRRGLLEQG
jgi:hypothetical protein